MIKFADISEFQQTFDPRLYLAGKHEVIIARVHNGYRLDRMMPGRAVEIRRVPFTAVGWYLYLAADRDPARQANEFCAAVGKLAANEFPIVDHEEGGGNQVSRCEAALNLVDRWAGFPTTLYSGASFLDNQLGGTARWKRPLWIAAYPTSYTANMALYPHDATFWQYSDRERFVGLPNPVDASCYPNSTQRFFADVRGGAAPPGPTGIVEQLAVQSQPDGDPELFALNADGTVWHRWLSQGGWQPWHSLGKPGG